VDLVSRVPLSPAEAARRRRRRTWTAVGIALTGGVLFVVLALQLAGNPNVKNHLAKGTFEVQVDVVTANAPFLVADPTGGGKNIFITTLPGDRFTAFEAHAPNDPRCLVKTTKEGFKDCHGKQYDDTGSGLVHFPTTVKKGNVVIDLRHAVQDN
jgi:hypothetical protein